ncbi:RNA polymerase sigma factor [Actinomadura viridis]|uniref:RNA polymerase sigma factor n=1 Tax=Actinomadura viridis TaxID=58110 RepID=UPI00369C42F6
MRGDLGTLYDAHADRLFSHCWSLLGDEDAAGAVRDAFVAAVRHPPRGDTVLWLYALSRSACADRGAFSGTGRPAFDGARPPGSHPAAAPVADPLLRAAGRLRPDHREALVLWAGEWLEVPDIAKVLGIAPDTVRELLHAARTRLERTVLDLLLRGAADPRLHTDVIAAFEKGRLPGLLARRAPARPPAALRDLVLAACEEEAARPLSEVTAPSPLVVIGPSVATPPGRGRARRTTRRGVGAVTGMAASVAAAVGLLMSWPSGKEGRVESLIPSSGSGQADRVSGSASPSGTGGGTATPGRSTDPAPSPATQEQRPARDLPPWTRPGTGPGAGDGSTPTGGASPSKPGSGTPARPDAPSTPPKDTPTPPDGTPGSPGEPTPPVTPPDPGPSDPPGTPAPSDPPEPSEPPSEPPAQEPRPEPTSNPAPSPSTGG